MLYDARGHREQVRMMVDATTSGTVENTPQGAGTYVSL
jgi:hypothetical protein